MDTRIRGLTAADAARRLAVDGPNELPTEKPRGIIRQAVAVLRQPMLLLLLAAGLINLALAEPLDGALLLVFVVVVIAISLYQEHRTERALTALRDLAAPRALVIRDGARLRIPGRDLVVGDLVVLAEGDRVPGDVVVLDAIALAADESALTGESLPVSKSAWTGPIPEQVAAPGGEGLPYAYAGSLVTAGHGEALLVATGSRTYLGGIGTALRDIAPAPTRLQREVDRLVRVLAFLGIGLALAIAGLYVLTRGGWLQGALAGIATAMAMLPEELPVVLTVFLAVGAWRMSRGRVLTRRPAAVEAIGGLTVLAVDKTGTLTQNHMTVAEVLGPSDALTWAALACPDHSADPMDRAFREAAGALPDWERVREFPVSPQRMAMIHVWRSPDNSRQVAAKGAPEEIARLCAMGADARVVMLAEVEAAAGQGGRVLGIARVRDAEERVTEDPESQQYEYLGLAVLRDPLRPGVPDAVAECARAGVRTLMMTGDHPATALAIAEAAGITTEGHLTGEQMAALDDAALGERVRTVSVFARMVPDQKLRLVRVLQGAGEVVGVTGDGVNDGPALRAADVGIAMGERGTDVAREAAALVITDDDYTSIVAGVRQGRGVMDNLRKAMAYIIAVHVPIIGMSLVPVLLVDWPLVLLPVQIAFLELVIDPACSVVFEAEQPDPRLMLAPPRRPDAALVDRTTLLTAVVQGVGVLAAVLLVYVWAVTTGHTDEQVRSVAFGALVVGNLALILVNRSWRLTVWQTLRQRHNRALPWVLGGAIVALVLLLAVPMARAAVGLGVVGFVEVMAIVLGGLVGVLWFEALKWARGRDAG